jgi:Leucine-rich repeat (LRR) protein
MRSGGGGSSGTAAGNAGTAGNGGAAGAAVTAGQAGRAGDAGARCEPIAFVDPALEAAVRRELDVESGALPPERVAAMESLEAPGVASFDGIECAIGLKRLISSGGGAVDAQPIGELRGLTLLSLGRQAFSTLEPLANLTSLESLYVRGTLRSASPEPLARLPKLRGLDVGDNGVADLRFLTGLAELESLNLSSTIAGDFGQEDDLQGLGPLAGMTGLKQLIASDSQISDLGALARLTRLERISVEQNQIADVGPLAGSIGLTFLRLTANRVTSLAPLANHRALQELHVDFNPLVEVGALAGMPELVAFVANNTDIADVTPLAGLPKLTSVVLSRTRIADLRPLATAGIVRTDCPWLDVVETPLDAASVSEAIPKLCELGWVVSWGPIGDTEQCRDERCPLVPP